MSSIRRARPAAAGAVALATAAFGAVALSPAATAAGPDTGSSASARQADRYIVTFQRGKSAEARAAISKAKGRIVLELPGRAAVAAVVPDGGIAELRRNGAVGYVEVDQVRTPTSIMPSAAKPDGVGGGKGKPGPTEPPAPTDPPPSATDTVVNGETVPYGLKTTQADQVSASGDLKKVCIIDSGYYADHADLRDEGQEVDGSIDPGNADDPGSGPWNTPEAFHGSHVAGTIASITGNSTGVASVFPNAPLHIVRVFGGPDEAWTYSSSLVAALDACTGEGDADVVSMSLGGGQKSRFEDQAFAAAYADGVLSIAAAGNDGNTRVSYPAGYASVVSVAAVDKNSAHASFSQRNSDVEIAAPGVGVLSTIPAIFESSMTADGTAVETNGSMEGSANATATGTLVDGGTCNTTVTIPSTAVDPIVFCQRGTETFETKVDNAIAAGAKGVVIYNNVVEDDLNSTLGGDVDIPVIVLSKATGEEVLANNVGDTVSITNYSEEPASGYSKYNGTSMATPHVSAIAAEIWSNAPTASAAQVRNAINATAFDLGDAGRDNATGFGLIQAKKALGALGG